MLDATKTDILHIAGKTCLIALKGTLTGLGKLRFFIIPLKSCLVYIFKIAKRFKMIYFRPTEHKNMILISALHEDQTAFYRIDTWSVFDMIYHVCYSHRSNRHIGA